MKHCFALITLMLVAPAFGWANCNISASSVAFGVYSPIASSPADFSGTLTLTCSAGSGTGAYTIALNTGAGSGTYSGRKMISGANSLSYQLYKDAAHTQIFGNGTGGSVVFTGSDQVSKTGGTSHITVYGQISARQAVPSGSYVDSATNATVTY
jgi:spore coat protein U-like protein